MDMMTNEALKGICPNNFELTHYAIALGRYYIDSGREVELGTLLKDVKKHPNPNYVEELKEMEKDLQSEETEERSGE